MISNDELKKLAKELIGGIDEFYAELHTLKSDIEFFNMYISRNRKSKFELNVMFKNSNFMNVLYDSYAKNIEYLNIILSYYIVIKAVINDIHENTNKFTIDKRKEILTSFVYYHKKEYLNYAINDFVGCSHSCEIVRSNINKLLDLTEGDQI